MLVKEDWRVWRGDDDMDSTECSSLLRGAIDPIGRSLEREVLAGVAEVETDAGVVDGMLGVVDGLLDTGSWGGAAVATGAVEVRGVFDPKSSFRMLSVAKRCCSRRLTNAVVTDLANWAMGRAC
jgi:hypothetical protein